jgi:hypothetical protein
VISEPSASGALPGHDPEPLASVNHPNIVTIDAVDRKKLTVRRGSVKENRGMKSEPREGLARYAARVYCRPNVVRR